MSKSRKSRISLNNANVKKVVFLYDNGRQYSATRIKNIAFNTHDVNGDPIVEYSQHSGNVVTVWKDDLAAVTVHYKNGVISTQRLLSCAVIRGKAYIPKKAMKPFLNRLGFTPDPNYRNSGIGVA